MLSKVLLLFFSLIWSMFYVFANLPSVMSTPEQVAFTHINKLTKYYSIFGPYQEILTRTKSAVVDKECREGRYDTFCDVNLQFIGPHPVNIDKWVQYTLTAKLRRTPKYGYVFEEGLTERDILKAAGSVPLEEAYDISEYISTHHDYDLYLWGVSFVISLFLAPLLFISFMASYMVNPKVTLGTTVLFIQLLIATYINIYVSGYEFSEFELYLSLMDKFDE